MDALLKLRVLIWVLVIGLWGAMVYQYLGEDESEASAMRPVVYRSVDTSAPAPASEEGALAAAGPPASAVSPAAPETGLLAAVAPAVVPPGAAVAPRPSDPTRNVLPPPDATGPAPATEDGDDAPAVVEAPPPPAPATPARAARRVATRARPSRREERFMPLLDPPVPPGFQKTVTRHFNVYSEQLAASDQFLELIENLHANLMLDLAPFTPWAADQRVSIFLSKNQDTYRRMTGRPPWSGGASSVPKRKVYVYESEELPGILAHELTHIYFDGFFLTAPGQGPTDPLWLSEGMATLVQVERGLAAPNWLRENLVSLESGGGIPIDDFVSVTTTSGWPDARVRLWYAQAYSLVRYLIRTQYRSSFYKFAAYLRDGRPTSEALYRAYGAPYTRLRALEIAWRHEISRSTAARAAAGN